MTAAMRGVLVGAGYFAAFHAEAWTRIPGAKLCAIVDADITKAQALADRYDVEAVHGSLSEAIAAHAPDFADIATPPATHRALCEEAAQAGLAIICQKPLAPTYAESVALVAAMDQCTSRFMVHENWRWQPWWRAMGEALNSGAIGTPHALAVQARLGDGWQEDAYMARQPYFRDYPRLLVHETVVHWLDVARALLGEAVSVYARLHRRNPAIKGEDGAHILIGFANGATAVLDVDRYNESEGDNPRFTFGTGQLDGSGGHVRFGEDGRVILKPLGAPARIISETAPGASFAGDCVHATQSHFIDALQSGAPFATEGADYLRTLALVEACYDSAAQDAIIRL